METEIDYSAIDAECRDFVRYFNAIGLPTIFSCQGHDIELQNRYEIIFDPCVTDESIRGFLRSISHGTHTPIAGQFVKWARWDATEIAENWCYIVSFGGCGYNQHIARNDLTTMRTFISG